MEASRRGIQIVTCRTPRDPVDRPVRGRGVSRGGSWPRAPAPYVTGMSSWYRGDSIARHFGGPELHPYAGHEYTKSSGHVFGATGTPWEDDSLSHDEAHLSAPLEDFFMGPCDTPFSLEASRLHGASGPTQPTQDPPSFTTPPQATRAGWVVRQPDPLTYSDHRRARPGVTRGVRPKRGCQ